MNNQQVKQFFLIYIFGAFELTLSNKKE